VAHQGRRLEPKLLDAARAAFRAEDDSLAGLADFLDKYGTNLDIGLGIFEMSRDVTEKLMNAKGLEIPAIGKYAQGLTQLNKGVSAINLALSMRGEAGKTEIDKGIKGIGFAAGAFSSLGTMFGVSAHIGMWSNLYLVPLTKACLDGVAKLAGHMHEENKTWVEAFGAPGNYAVEPGGKPMWDYIGVGHEGQEREVGRRALRRRGGVLHGAASQVQHRRQSEDFGIGDARQRCLGVQGARQGGLQVVDLEQPPRGVGDALRLDEDRQAVRSGRGQERYGMSAAASKRTTPPVSRSVTRPASSSMSTWPSTSQSVR
jgi:hypothetical protein